MEISQSSVREAAEINSFGTTEIITRRFTDYARELNTTYPANTPGFKGNGSGNGRIG
jgi:hypothetical protein